jgi:hypothetical protein
MGRPSKLTAARKQRIIETISAGQTQETACGLVGISRKTLREWLKKGEDQSSGPYREFFDSFQKAFADAEVQLVRAVWRIAIGGVWMLPVYDEHGNRMVDERGKPRVRRMTLLPNGRLALKLLARSDPQEWGGKPDPVAAVDHHNRPELPPGTIIKLFSEAFQIMWDYGLVTPASLPNMSEVEPEAPEK